MASIQTLTFFSNYLNLHVLGYCQEWYRQLGDGFTFVSTVPFTDNDGILRHRILGQETPFYLPGFLDAENEKKGKWLGAHSDVVISGGVADAWIAPRLAQNRLTFRMTERPLKPQDATLKNPYTAAAMWWRNTRYKNRNLYLLASGNNVAQDFARIGAYKGKAYRWGYFPPVPPSLQRTQPDKPAPIRLLWAGRMIPYKRPGYALALAEALEKAGVDYELHFVGKGELEDSLKQQAAALGLTQRVRFLGEKTAAEMEQEMQSSDIFLFTSDENEGWGAVLNEAMGAGCAALACERAGATNFLIRQGENGVVFFDTQQDFVERGVALAQDRALCARLGQAAYNTLHSLWNGTVAAQRLLALSEGLLGHAPLPSYPDGPCSKIEN